MAELFSTFIETSTQSTNMSSLLADEHSTQRPREPEPRCPIDTFQLRRNIAGVDTELLVQTFDDRILVLITQNGKVGPLVSRR